MPRLLSLLLVKDRLYAGQSWRSAITGSLIIMRDNGDGWATSRYLHYSHRVVKESPLGTIEDQVVYGRAVLLRGVPI